jgi:hypothetical protein
VREHPQPLNVPLNPLELLRVSKVSILAGAALRSATMSEVNVGTPPFFCL